MVPTFFQAIKVSQQKPLHARLVLSLVTLIFQPPHSTFCNSAVVVVHLILSSSSVLPCVPPSCLLASFLPLHLYYPLNNSLCIEVCVCSFCSQSPEGVSLEALVVGRTCFFVRVPYPSLCFLPFLCFQEILLCDTVWDSSHPKYEMLPIDMRRPHVCLLLMCISDDLYPFLSLSCCWWQ